MKLTELQSQFIAMISEQKAYYNQLNPIWRTAIECLRYVLYLPEWELPRLRMHSGLFTGQQPYQYWHATGDLAAAGRSIARNTGYEYLVSGLPDEYRLYEPENPAIPGRMGLPYKGSSINFDVAHFQNVVTNLFLTGELQRLWSRAAEKRVILVEIGSGYGGLAFHIHRILQRRTTCVLVDLPEILLFAAAYFAAHSPKVRITLAANDSQMKAALKEEYDVILVPSFHADALHGIDAIDFAINMDSFQEMNRRDVEHYCSLIFPRLNGIFYVDNIDRHYSLNTDAIESLSTILSRYAAIYPNPVTYETFMRGRGWSWFYSIYLLGKPDFIAQCTKQLKGIAGDSRRGQPFEVKNEHIKFANPFWQISLCLRGAKQLFSRLKA